MNRSVAVLLYSLACGALLVAFSFTPGILRYVFSLGAFLLGLKFFGTYETWGMRSAFIGGALVVFFIAVFIVSVFIALYGWEIPGISDLQTE